MTLFVFPYNLQLPIMAATQSFIVSFGALLIICAAMALVVQRVLPARVSALQVIALVALWGGASFASLHLVLTGSGVP